MATYHCSLKQGKVGTAQAHSDYIRREGKYALGEKKEELQYAESGNLPEWAENAKAFFAAADLYERNNGTAYTEFELALPNELNLEENIKLVQEFVKEHIGDQKVYSFAIHDKNATLDPTQRQPHVHLMFSERIITDKVNVKPPERFFKRYNTKNPESGGYKKDIRFRKANGIGQNNIRLIRAAWAEKINSAYAAKGLDIKVSEKSLKNQRIEAFMENNPEKYDIASRPAEKHLGSKDANRLKEILKNGNYRFEELPDKARLTLIAREIRKIALEEAIYKREIKAVRAARAVEAAKITEVRSELKDYKLDYVIIHGNRLTKTIYDASLSISKQIAANTDRIEALQKMVLSEESIRSIAVSVYTRGKSKQLNKALRQLALDKEKLAKEYKAFKNMAQPKFYQLNYKNSYKKQEQSILQRLEKLNDTEAKLNLEKAALNRELQKKDVQRKVESIENILRTKNFIRENQILKLKKTNKSLAKLGQSCLNLKNKVNDKIKYKLKKEVLNTVKQVVVKDLQGSLATINKAINKARDEEVKGHMRIDLQVDVTNER